MVRQKQKSTLKKSYPVSRDFSLCMALTFTKATRMTSYALKAIHERKNLCLQFLISYEKLKQKLQWSILWVVLKIYVMKDLFESHLYWVYSPRFLNASLHWRLKGFGFEHRLFSSLVNMNVTYFMDLLNFSVGPFSTFAWDSIWPWTNVD